jgi:hypothetical protein
MTIVTAGDKGLDKRKYKFGFTAKILSPAEALEYAGRPAAPPCPAGGNPRIPGRFGAAL